MEGEEKEVKKEEKRGKMMGEEEEKPSRSINPTITHPCNQTTRNPLPPPPTTTTTTTTLP